MNHASKKVTVLGLGRVGLITAFSLAKRGFFVQAVDINKNLVESLRRGQFPFHEEGYSDLLKKYQRTIDFFNEPRQGSAYFICVESPYSEETGNLETRVIETALSGIQKVSGPEEPVFIRSTLSPGSTRELAQYIDPSLLYCYPEFFREGAFVEDENLGMICALGSANQSGDTVNEFVPENCEAMSWEEAETLKLSCNFFHGLKVAFANEVGRVCEEYDADPYRVMEMFCKDTHLNISSKYLKPGFAYGGPCLTKDIKGFHASSSTSPMSLATEESNQLHIEWSAGKVLRDSPSKVGLLGIGFKQGVDDLRGSKVIDLGIQLRESQSNLQLFTMDFENDGQIPGAQPVKNFEELVDQCDSLVLGNWHLTTSEIDLLAKSSVNLIDLCMGKQAKKLASLSNYKTIYGK